jgi:ubiquinone/menaquinone biosynthesis C-methylase UbiE
VDDLEQAKQGARAAWSAGDFTRFAEMIGSSRGRLLGLLDIGPDDEVLDVGSGYGNLAIEAAATGASVTGVDIAPGMVAMARRAAEVAGSPARFEEGDAEDLAAETGSVDVVMSSFACMFAPRHAVTAGELARVLRPGGRMGVLAWTPDSDIAQFIRVTVPHLPPPPSSAQPPLLWGDEDHVRGIFAGTGLELSFARDTVTFPTMPAQEIIEVHLREFGPLVAARAMLEPQGRWQALVDDVSAFFRSKADADGSVTFTSDYVIVLGRAPD